MNYWDTEEWKAANNARATAYANLWTDSVFAAANNPHRPGSTAWTDHQLKAVEPAKQAYIAALTACRALEVATH